MPRTTKSRFGGKAGDEVAVAKDLKNALDLGAYPHAVIDRDPRAVRLY